MSDDNEEDTVQCECERCHEVFDADFPRIFCNNCLWEMHEETPKKPEPVV